MLILLVLTAPMTVPGAGSAVYQIGAEVDVGLSYAIADQKGADFAESPAEDIPLVATLYDGAGVAVAAVAPVTLTKVGGTKGRTHIGSISIPTGTTVGTYWLHVELSGDWDDDNGKRVAKPSDIGRRLGLVELV